MDRRLSIPAGLALLALLTIGGWYWLDSAGKPPAYTFEGSRVLQYSFTISNPTGKPESGVEFSTYVPARNTSMQGVATISTEHPFQEQVDELGNTILNFTLPQLAPYGSKILTIRAVLPVSETPLKQKLVEPARFLSPEPYIESEHPDLKGLAATIRAQVSEDNPQALAQAAYSWVAANLKSEQYLPDDRGALWAYQNRRGDCTEFMYLYVALTRLLGIPARGVSGYVVEGSQILHPADFHNWAEIYLNGAWQVVDPQRQVFLQKQADYIAMRIIQPPDRSLLAASHRYRLVQPNLTAIMN